MELLGIDRGGCIRVLIPVILLSGGVAILLLDRFFPGDVLGLRLPEFPREGQSRQRADQAPMDFRQGCGRRDLARRGRVGRPRRSDRAGRRRDRLDHRAAPKAVARSRQGAGRGRRRRRHRDHLQRADRRPDVRAGDRPARPHRNRQPYAADHRDFHRRGDLARDPGQRRRLPGAPVRAAKLLGDG